MLLLCLKALVRVSILFVFICNVCLFIPLSYPMFLLFFFINILLFLFSFFILFNKALISYIFLFYIMFIEQTRISHFQLKLMDIDSEHLGIPDTKYQCAVEMPATEFQRICREIAVIGDTVKISASKDGVKFAVAGDMGTGSITLKQNSSIDDDEDDVISVKVEEECTLTFALRYLNFFAKATPLSSTVILKMSPEVPLSVCYQIGDNGDMGQLQYFLAPKIEDEEEE